MLATIGALRSRGTKGTAGEHRAGVGAVAVLAADELERYVRPEDGRHARLEDSPKAVANPATRRRWRFHQQSLPRELTRTQRLEPDAVGRLVDGLGKLALHPCP